MHECELQKTMNFSNHARCSPQSWISYLRRRVTCTRPRSRRAPPPPFYQITRRRQHSIFELSKKTRFVSLYRSIGWHSYIGHTSVVPVIYIYVCIAVYYTRSSRLTSNKLVLICMFNSMIMTTYPVGYLYERITKFGRNNHRKLQYINSLTTSPHLVLIINDIR